MPVLNAYNLLLLGAFGTCVGSAIGKVPLWIPVMLTIVALLVKTFGV